MAKSKFTSDIFDDISGSCVKWAVTLITILSLLTVPIHIFGLQTENKLLFPKSMFPQSDAYKAGWTAGFLDQPLKGHHTNDYIFGFLNGTSIIHTYSTIMKHRDILSISISGFIMERQLQMNSIRKEEILLILVVVMVRNIVWGLIKDIKQMLTHWADTFDR